MGNLRSRSAALLTLTLIGLALPAAVRAQQQGNTGAANVYVPPATQWSPAHGGQVDAAVTPVSGPTLEDRLRELGNSATAQPQSPGSWPVSALQQPGAAPGAPPSADERFRQLEAANRELTQQLNALNRKLDTLSGRRPATPARSGSFTSPAPRTEGGLRTTAEERSAEIEEEVPPPERGPYVPNMPPVRQSIITSFQEGLRWRTPDDYFALEFHNLTQADLRLFDPTGDPLHDGFIIPRQRWYFIGHVSDYVDYYTVINRGYGSLDLLDSWADFSLGEQYKDYISLRVGRMKTPYTYEYIKISESDLIAPERSLFVGNFAPNREIGAMFHGRILQKQVEYYLGVFNGPRRSFEDFNNGKDLFFFTNTKPFLMSDWEFLRQLNLGGSFNYGQERNPTSPTSLRTASDQTASAGADAVSPTFFVFNSRAFENGLRMQWSGDLAYYYKSFGLLAGYQGGIQDYSLFSGTLPSELVGVGAARSTRVPISGWSVAAFWLVTGEEITRRSYLLEPIRPFSIAGGQYGPGAWELYSRFSNLHVGSDVFGAGLAAEGPWSNTANAIDTGVNWYLNHYVKMTFDWQHTMMPTPVYLAPGRTTNKFDLFWFRTQIFF
jgi:phosphate-selective porin OprO/OprP